MADEKPAENTATNKGPFWLGWKLTLNAQKRWESWMKSFTHFEPVPPDELHFTMFYCEAEDNPEQEWPQPMSAAWNGTPCGVGVLGKALVVLFDAPQFVHSRFKQLSVTHKHSFPTLIPHMTLTYDANEPYTHSNDPDALRRLFEQIKENNLPLSFVNEQIQALKDPTQNKDESVYMDIMSELSLPTAEKPWLELPFMQAFTRAFRNNPDIAKAFESGNAEIYKKNLVKLIADLENERHRL